MIIFDKLDIINNSHTLINPFKEEWKNNNTTNCYAYALGLDIDYNKLSIKGYEPGFTFYTPLPPCFEGEDLLNHVVKDLDNLKIDFRYVNAYYKLAKGEWKIAIFGGFRNSWDLFDDYHFMKQTKDGVWVHKNGYYSKPMKLSRDFSASYVEDDILYNHLITLCLRR